MWEVLVSGGTVIGVFFITQMVVLQLFVTLYIPHAPHIYEDVLSRNLESNGLLLSLVTCATTLTGTCVIWGFIKGRGESFRDILGLYSVEFRSLLHWLCVTVFLIIVSGFLTRLLGRPVVPDFLIQAFATCGILPLFLVVVVIIGPFFEELFFRGFLLEGFQRSWIGFAGGMVVTSLLWAGFHFQYDAFDKGQIFILGLVLAWARRRTGSLYTTLVMHAFINGAAILETMIHLWTIQRTV
jgi:membrane protease YdiL (CAAX protease family)